MGGAEDSSLSFTRTGFYTLLDHSISTKQLWRIKSVFALTSREILVMCCVVTSEISDCQPSQGWCSMLDFTDGRLEELACGR